MERQWRLSRRAGVGIDVLRVCEPRYTGRSAPASVLHRRMGNRAQIKEGRVKESTFSDVGRIKDEVLGALEHTRKEADGKEGGLRPGGIG